MNMLVRNTGQRPMLRMEQNSVVVMSYILRKLTSPGATVRGLCIRTGAIASCLMEPRHRNASGWDSEGACVEIMITSLLNPSSYNLNKNFNIFQNVKVFNVANSLSSIVQFHTLTLQGLPKKPLNTIQACICSSLCNGVSTLVLL